MDEAYCIVGDGSPVPQLAAIEIKIVREQIIKVFAFYTDKDETAGGICWLAQASQAGLAETG